VLVILSRLTVLSREKTDDGNYQRTRLRSDELRRGKQGQKTEGATRRRMTDNRGRQLPEAEGQKG
jgi:hypothetical protein